MAEKIYNVTDKFNYIPFLSCVCLFINAILITFFKNTSLRPTYSCRAFMLVAAILLILGAGVEIYNVVYRFIKSKGKLKFALGLVLAGIAFALAVWACVKYFTDFAIYYVHNNNTNLIIISSIVALIVHFCYQNFDKFKEKYVNFILLGIIFLASFIYMLCVKDRTDISQFYIFSISTVITASMLLVDFYQQTFRKIASIAFYAIAWIMLLATFIATLINRSVIDVFNMIFLFAIVAMLLITVVTCNRLHQARKHQLVYRLIIIVLALFLFFKIMFFDRDLKEFDLSRLLSLFVFIALTLSMLNGHKDKVSLAYLVSIAAVTLAYIISASILYTKKTYEVGFYRCEIVFFSLIAVLALSFIITMLVLAKYQKKQVAMQEKQDNPITNP